MIGTRTYEAWAGMNRRCNNPRNKRYASYGGRGITICERWKVFENFFADMGEVPEGLSLERRDNNLGYTPENCKWGTLEEQMNNTRRNRYFEYRGQKLTAPQIARLCGLPIEVVRRRLLTGWDIERAVTQPVDEKFWRNRQRIHPRAPA